MECPYCNDELILIDYWGRGIPGTSSFQKRGDIYACGNTDCEASHDYTGTTFYTDSPNSDDLIEGYPC